MCKCATKSKYNTVEMVSLPILAYVIDFNEYFISIIWMDLYWNFHIFWISIWAMGTLCLPDTRKSGHLFLFNCILWPMAKTYLKKENYETRKGISLYTVSTVSLAYGRKYIYNTIKNQFIIPKLRLQWCWKAI